MLTVKNLTAKVTAKKIIDNFNFTFEKGKIYAIMGPNGSGKSTLAHVVMGHPSYQLDKKSSIIFENKNIIGLTADKRAKKGLFLSFQSPLSLSGISVYQLMRYALGDKVDLLAIRKKVQSVAAKLKIHPDLLARSFNEGFSGGERKKLEMLQAILLDAKLAFFDEIDTGVDVDSLKLIAKAMLSLKSKEKTLVIITHYNRILKYIKPDFVLVIINGKLVKTGGANLASEIENKGYEIINSK